MAYGNARLLELVCCIAAVSIMFSGANAADPSDYLGSTGRHRILTGDMPPGYLGQARLAGRGLVRGYFQPIALTGPKGTRFALTRNGGYEEGTELLQAGLLVGSVYRFQVTRIPMMEGAELYPTLEVIDRTYPPPGLATRYPIVINLDLEDLQSALEGKMVTRVIFLEDPQTAVPLQQTPMTNRPVDIAENQDALEVADRLGRPVAIVRIGSVAPPRTPALMPSFFFGFPTWAPIQNIDASGSHAPANAAQNIPVRAAQPLPSQAQLQHRDARSSGVAPAVTVTDQPLLK
jgi:hypothetical protein